MNKQFVTKSIVLILLMISFFPYPVVAEGLSDYVAREVDFIFGKSYDCQDPNGAWKTQYEILNSLKEDDANDWLIWNELSSYQDILATFYMYDGGDGNQSYEFWNNAALESANRSDLLIKDETIESIENRQEDALVKGYRYILFANRCLETESVLECYELAYQLWKPYGYGYVPMEREMSYYIGMSQSMIPFVFKPYGTSENYLKMYLNTSIMRCFKLVYEEGIKLYPQIKFDKGVSDTFRRMAEANAALAYAAYRNKDNKELYLLKESASQVAEKSKNTEGFSECEFYSLHISALYFDLLEDQVGLSNIIDPLKKAFSNWIYLDNLNLFNTVMVNELEMSIDLLDQKT